MKLLKIKYIAFALAIGLFSTFAISAEFDRDYESALRQGRVTTLVGYIQRLSTAVDTDDEPTKVRKCDALKYFFATGGRDGFRQTPATPQELVILTHALAVATALHYEVDGAEVLDLCSIRRRYGRSIDDRFTSHFVAAQAIIAYTLIVYQKAQINSSTVVSETSVGFSVESIVMFPVVTVSSYNRIYLGVIQPLTYATPQALQEVFIQGLTISTGNTILQALKSTGHVQGDVEEFDETKNAILLRFLGQILSLPTQPSSQASSAQGGSSLKSNIRVRLSNGWVAERLIGQYVRLTGPGVGSIQAGRGINLNGLKFDKDMTDQEIRDALSSAAAILSVEYI